MQLPRRTPKLLRRAAIGLLVLLALYAAVGSIYSRYYKSLVLAKLPALAAKATDSLYDITVDDIRVNIFTREVSVSGLRMQVKQDVLRRRIREGRVPHAVLDVLVPEAEVSGVHWRDLKKERELTCRNVHFHEPEIRVSILPGWQTRPARPAPQTPAVSRVHARRIVIESPKFEVRYANGDSGFSFHSNGGLITATDWDYRPHQTFDTSRFFAARSADVKLEQIVYLNPNSLYSFALGSLHFQTQEHLLQIAQLHIKPAGTYEESYERIGHRKSLYTCRLPIATLSGFQWRRLLSPDHALIASKLQLDTPQLVVYLSKRPPPDPHARLALFPTQWLQQFALPVRLGVISVWDGSVEYTEMNGKTEAVGSLLFNYLRGSVINMTNMPGAIRQHPNCDVFASGKLAHRADLAAIVRFPLADTMAGFRLEARLKGLDAGGIRPAVQAMAIADIKSLQIPEASLSLTGNKDTLYGQAVIAYNKLKLKLRKFNDVDSDVHNRVLLSFLANKILLYDANPMPGGALRAGPIALGRGEIRTFLQFIWKGIFQAGMRTALREEGAYDIAKRRKAAIGKPKSRFFKDLFPKRRK